MKIPNSIVPVTLKNSVCLPEKHIVEDTDRQHAFCYRNVQLTLVNMHPMDSMCIGPGCDGYNSFEGNKKCACFTAHRRMSNVILVMDLKAVTTGNKKLYIRAFTSKKFSNFHFKDGKIPPDLRASQLCTRRERVSLRRSVERQIAYVNGGGALASDANISANIKSAKKGHTLVGWCRRGTVIDQAAEDPSNRNHQDVVVDSSILTYHLTSIRPTCPEVLTGINELKYDTTHLTTSTNPGGANGGANGGPPANVAAAMGHNVANGGPPANAVAGGANGGLGGVDHDGELV